jgi:hypothetical protein
MVAIQMTYVTHIGTCITVETVNDDNSTLDLGPIDTLAVGSKRLIVNESEVVVYSSRVLDSEVDKF